MRFWTLDPRRSLRWRVWRDLNARRTVRGLDRARAAFSRALRRSDWRLVFGVSLGLYALPLIAFLGTDEPGWVGVAWQVSAGLVALVLALIIFLLQAAGAQSLRTRSTYRAIIGETALIWPLALTLCFIAWAGVVARFSAGKTGPPGWANTYALALFVAQTGGFAAVFVRMLDLVSPQSVLRVIERAFVDDISLGVYDKLRRKEGERLFSEAAQSVGLTSGPFSGVLGGYRVEAGRDGRVVDVDLWLPKKLRDCEVAERASVGVGLGTRISQSTALARVRGDRDEKVDRAVRRAFAVRRSQSRESAPLDVFSEALGVARRAVKDGGRDSMQDAADLLVACVSSLPRCYRALGADYDATMVSEGLLPPDEDQLLHELRRFIDEVLRTGSDDAVSMFTELGLRLLVVGVDEHAPYLVDQALRFLVGEAFLASVNTQQPRRGQVLSLLADLAQTSVKRLRYMLQDETLPEETRFEVVPALAELFAFQATLLRIDVEADDLDTFKRTWRRSINWNEHWRPEDDVEDLGLQLGDDASTGDTETAAKLEDARNASAVKSQLDQAHQLSLFQAGAWLADSMRVGSLEPVRWNEVLPYLVGPFHGPQDIVDATAGFWDGDARLALLRRWQMERLTEDGQVINADYRHVGTRWAIVLLLRSTSESEPPSVDLGESGESLGRLLEDDLTGIEQEHEKWATAVNGDVQAKVTQLRAAIGAAKQAALQETARVVAAAGVSNARVAKFAQDQREAFAEHALLRRKLGEAGVLRREEPRKAHGGGFGFVTGKRPFVDQEHHGPVINWTQPGKQAAHDEQHGIGAALAAVADAVATPDAVTGAVEAIEQMGAAGTPADVVLVPSRIWIRPLLRTHPDFRWSGRGPRDRTEIGFLREVPVLDVLPIDGDYMLVVNFRRAARVVEKWDPADESPLHVEVRPIDETRANELVDAGRASELMQRMTREDVIHNLIDYTVEILADVEYEVTAQEGAAAAIKRFTLGAETMGRQTVEAPAGQLQDDAR